MEEKAFIVDRLYKRDAKRLEMIQQQHKLKEDINASNEQIDYFCTIFKEKTDSIETALVTVNKLQGTQLANHFDKIRTELRDLQKYVAASSLFLKDYNLRKSQDIIQDLQARSADLENIHFPKKKFGFRNKKSLAKSNERDEVDNCRIEKEIKKVVNKKTWDVITCGFTNVKNEKLTLDGETVYKKDVSLSYLSDCVVIIRGNPGTLHLDHISNSVILCGPVSTSIFIDRCTNCKMVLACQQLRFHSSADCDIYLHVTSKAIIEDCTGIGVAPYNFAYDGLDKDFAMSTLDMNTNNWNALDDFNWLASGISSPNWKILDEKLRITNWDSHFIDK